MSLLKQWVILCRNIRGINAREKQLALMNAIKVSGCSIICLQETKKEDFDLQFIKSCCPAKFDEFVFVPSVGASGGLNIIWNSSIFSGMVMHCEKFALSVHFTSTHSGQSWTLINIYGPCNGELREKFIEWMFEVHIPDDEDWILLGDFNFIRSPATRNKLGGNVNDMLIFNDFIREQHLTELPIKGRKYTWSNMQQDPLLEQLDWFSPPFTGQLVFLTQLFPHKANQPLITLPVLFYSD